MTLPDIVQSNQLRPTGLDQSQLYLLVSFYVLLRHNLFLLRNYRNDYLMSFRLRLDFLPQGVGKAPSNAARDRMLALTETILTEMRLDNCRTAGNELDTHAAQLSDVGGKLLPNQSQAPLPTAVIAAHLPPVPSSHHDAACAAVDTLLRYLQDASSARSQLCDISEICRAVIEQCQPLLKEREVDMTFDGRQSVLPLRVLLVDDNAFVRLRPPGLCTARSCLPHCVCRCEGSWNDLREIEVTTTSPAATANRV
jgi:hypothetical protein